MHIYIDTEFNEYQGALISMALVAEDHREWYEVVELAQPPGEWVAKNVMPKLGRQAVTRAAAAFSLHDWLRPYPRIHLVADLPDDIKHFCELIVTGPGQRIDTPSLTMEIRRDIASDASAIPHNALEDARALMHAAHAKQPPWS